MWQYSGDDSLFRKRRGTYFLEIANKSMLLELSSLSPFSFVHKRYKVVREDNFIDTRKARIILLQDLTISSNPTFL